MFNLFPFETYAEKCARREIGHRCDLPYSWFEYRTLLPEPEQIRERRLEDGSTLLLLPVPGLDKKDITILEDSKVLTISYKKNKEDKRELFLDSFEYKIKLPTVLTSKITARVENGLLTILLLKKEDNDKTKLIEIT